tara:strand:+ start:1884 stop:2012 length:129 start_codon:yes stop_codon:yes gene_type:complete
MQGMASLRSPRFARYDTSGLAKFRHIAFDDITKQKQRQALLL